jgi:opacity protein-like surface antigen
MTPFDINPDNDAGHSIDQDDLIAFHLRELPRAQERALHRAMKHNPYLQAESIAIASTLRAFPKQEPSLPLDAAALDRHWQTLRTSLAPHIPTAAAPRRLFLPWSLPLFATVAIAAALLLLSHEYHQQPQPALTATATPPSAEVRALVPSKTFANSTDPHSASTAFSITRAANSNLHADTPIATPINAAPPAIAAFTPPETSQPTPNPSAAQPFTTTPAPTTLASAAPLPAASPIPQADHSPAAITSFAPTRARAPRSFYHTGDRTDIALSLEGFFANSASPGNSNFYRQNPAASAGGLVEFRHIAKPLLGWEATYSFHRADQVYDELIETGGGVTSCGSTTCPIPTYAVSANQQKFTADWVASGHVRSFRPFVLLGAALILTQPVSGQSNTATATEAAFDYGAGLDARLTRHLGLRLQYRGDLYKAPGIVPPNNTSPATGFMHSSEPAIGVFYSF